MCSIGMHLTLRLTPARKARPMKVQLTEDLKSVLEPARSLRPKYFQPVSAGRLSGKFILRIRVDPL
jgi:hypothetical protein